MSQRPDNATSASATPTTARAPRYVACPDCAAIVAPSRCRPLKLPLGIFVECPECAVGSRIEQYKEAKLS